MNVNKNTLNNWLEILINASFEYNILELDEIVEEIEFMLDNGDTESVAYLFTSYNTNHVTIESPTNSQYGKIDSITPLYEG